MSPTPTRIARLTRMMLAVGAMGAVAALTACSGITYAETPVPAKSVTPATKVEAAPAGPAAECGDPLRSYDPLPKLPPTGEITDRAVRQILERGHLVVGVSADTYLLGARNPLTGQIEGFDIDIARAVAQSLFGDPDRIQLRVITATQRMPFLQERRVDLVVRNMTITCDRWEKVAFSAEYYRSGQKVLVAKGSEAQELADLKGQRVCAPRSTSTLDNLEKVPGVIPVPADNHTGCLVLFQQGKVDAITGDDTVLAGLAAQDPYAVVTKAAARSAEPYGIAVNQDDVYLVRYLNRLLADMETDGRWKQIYDRWLADTLGKAPAPPKAVYGRS